MKIDKFAKTISKMPKFVAYAILGFYALFMPKKLNQLVEEMNEAVKEQEDEAIRLVKEMSEGLKNMTVELKGRMG